MIQPHNEQHWIGRRATLTKQIAADKAKLAKFEKTGEPAWLKNPDAMFAHRVNCHLRKAELDFLIEELDAA